MRWEYAHIECRDDVVGSAHFACRVQGVMSSCCICWRVLELNMDDSTGLLSGWSSSLTSQWKGKKTLPLWAQCHIISTNKRIYSGLIMIIHQCPQTHKKNLPDLPFSLFFIDSNVLKHVERWGVTWLFLSHMFQPTISTVYDGKFTPQTISYFQRSRRLHCVAECLMFPLHACG